MNNIVNIYLTNTMTNFLTQQIQAVLLDSGVSIISPLEFFRKKNSEILGVSGKVTTLTQSNLIIRLPYS